jgi:competence protein ComEC
MYVSRPLIPLVVSLVSGIGLGAVLGGYSAWVAVLLAVSFGDIACRLYRRRDGLPSPLLLFFALGYLCIQPWLFPRLPSNHVSRYIGSHPWQISGTIISEPLEQKHLQKFVLQAESLFDVRSGRVDVVGKMRVTVSGLEQRLQHGERIALRGRIRAVHGFKNPGAFDYERYMAYRGIWTTAYARGKDVSRLPVQTDGRMSDVVDGYRRRIAELIESRGRPEQQAVLKALVIGDRSSISHELRDAFQRAGAGHLLAISGLHIGIVATVTFVLFRWIFGFVRPLLWCAWIRPAAAVAAVLPVSVYGMLSGWAASTQRAVLMVVVFLAGFLVRREQDGINTLAFAALLILVVSPPMLFSISFQLSFAAVLFILCGLGRVSEGPREPAPAAAPSMIRRLTKQVGALFRVSLLAIGGTLPLVMYYFNQVSLVGILTNLILIPLVGFVVVPIGLLGALAAPINDQLALGCLAVCHALLIPALAIVRGFAQLPFGALYTITPSPVEIACYYAFLWAAIKLGTTRRPKSEAAAYAPSDFARPLSERPKRDSWLQRLWTLSTRKPAKCVLAISLLVLAIDGLYWLHHRFWHEDVRVTIVDVGPGTANLVELPGGFTMLIDGGGFADNSIFDVGAQIIAPLLWRQKIRTVDTLVLSHSDSDHVNGLIFIAKHFHVKTVWLTGEARKTRGYLGLLEVVAARNIARPQFRALDRNLTVHGVRISVLYPPPDFLDKVAWEKWRTPNNNSLVVKIAYGDVSFLFPGDIMSEAEAELVRMAGAELASTVLIAPHHGSRTSSSPSFLEAVRPEVVVCSSGRLTAAGVPHPSVLAAYVGLNARVFLTARHGAIRMSTDGHGLTVDPVVSAGMRE